MAHPKNKSTLKNIKFYREYVFIGVAIVFFVSEILALKEIIVFPQYIQLGILQPRIYGLLITASVVLVSVLFQYYSAKIKILKKVKIEDLLLYAVIPGVIGARLYHLITDWHLYQNDPWSALLIWNGGIGLFGGLVGGLIGIYLYARKNKINFVAIIDLLVVFLSLAQIIGRMGNLINHELYGFPTDLPWAWQISSLNGSFHPTFLYEQIGNLILFVILYGFFKKNRFRIGEGKLALTYFAGYSVIRFCTEFFRTSPRVLWNVITVDQLTCFIIFTVVTLIAYKYIYRS